MNYKDFIAKVKQLPKFSAQDIKKHNKIADAWIVLANIFDEIDNPIVLDITKFINEHPGGSDILLPYLGKECGQEFLQYHVEGTSDAYDFIMSLTIGTML